jgi:hypothetical protein
MCQLFHQSPDTPLAHGGLLCYVAHGRSGSTQYPQKTRGEGVTDIKYVSFFYTRSFSSFAFFLLKFSQLAGKWLQKPLTV